MANVRRSIAEIKFGFARCGFAKLHPHAVLRLITTIIWVGVDGGLDLSARST